MIGVRKLAFGVVAAVLSLVAWAETYTWTAGVSGNWEDGANWTSSQSTTGTAPGAEDAAIVPGAAANYTVTVNQRFSIARLVVGSQGTDTNVTLCIKHREENAVSGDVHVLSGAKITHTVLPTSANTPVAECYRVALAVGGNVTVDAGGSIDVTGCGYANGKGPGYKLATNTDGSTHNTSAHGGRYAIGAACYGSLVAPTNCGSGAGSAGGGAVRIRAVGDLVVNGTVAANGGFFANYASGAGGSVWLTGARLSGSGMITANSGGMQWGTSGGGGRVAIWLGVANGQEEWSGTVQAVAGLGGSWGLQKGPAGTVYFQTGSGGVTNSMTIVDNNGTAMAYDGYAELGAATDSAVLGTLIVRNKGRVRIASGDEVAFLGSIDTTGGTTYLSGSTVRLAGPASATLSGSQPYYNFICEEPGKLVSFGTAASDLFEIADNGNLTLRGDETTKLDLRPDDSLRSWKMKLAASAKMDVYYVSVSNSDASAGQSVGSFGSDDLGGNVKWTFSDPIVPGEEIVWTGATDGDWQNPGNWDRGRAVAETDDVRIPATVEDTPVAHMPVLGAGTHLFNRLTIETGASLSLTNDCRVTITNALSVAGVLRATGAEKIICPKDVSFAGGAFEAGSSYFCLEGTGVQSVDPNGQAFAHLMIEKPSGSVSFTDGFTASIFAAFSTNALTLSFAPGKTVDARTCFLRGRRTDGGRALTLRSTTAGSAWKLKVGDVQSVAGVDVADSDAREGAEVLADASHDATGNSNWAFDSGVVNAAWIGGDGAFETGANWDTGVAPGPGTNALILAKLGAPVTVTANAAVSVRDLTVRGRETTTATFVSNTKDVHCLSGDLVIGEDGVAAHTPGNETYAFAVEADGFLKVEAGGKIDVTGCGYANEKGPGYLKSEGGDNTASHGGRYAVGAACYGSLVAPTNCGSGAGSRGGGAVRIRAVGDLVVDGTIAANGGYNDGYSSGSGGSVWLTGTTLTGSGMISANSGGVKWGTSGGGGRVSVWLSTANGLDGWSGTMRAHNGGKGSNYGLGAGAAGTVYMQTGDRGVTNSVTIVDNNGTTMKEEGYAELGAATDSAVLGTLVVRNKGRVRIASGDEVAFLGSIDTTGGTTYLSGSTVRLAGPVSATLSGSQPYYNFICEEPGKLVSFGTAASDLFEIADNGRLTFLGNGSTRIDLRPADLSKTWAMKLAESAKADVYYVSVSNSNASAGQSVGAIGSDDLGGNVKWTFTAPIVPGEEIVWTGATDGDWLNPGNWDRGRAVAETDAVRIPATVEGTPVAHMPVLGAGTHLLYRLTVQAGATLTLTGDCQVTFADGLSVAGTLRASGLEKIVCTKDASFAGGAFEAGSSYFCLEGTGVQSVDPNGQTFANLMIGKSGGSVTFGHGFTASLLDVASTNALTLSFAAGEVVDARTCFLRGRRADGGQGLVLRSATAGSAWKFKVGRVHAVTGVNVSDSDAREGVEVLADDSVGGSGNFNWSFGSGVANATWIGGDGAFETGANWDTGVAPGPGTNALLLASEGTTRTVTANGPLSVRNLVVLGQRGAQSTFESGTKGAHAVSGELFVGRNGMLTHTQGNETYVFACDVGGGVRVDVGGQIDVTGCGYASGKGPGYVLVNQTQLASHGGCYAVGAACYGSLVAPTNCGSGAGSTGGGAVRIFAVGELAVNGTVTANGGFNANYGSGSGGSVWLKGATLTGSGAISANSGDAWYGANGGGGRIAVWVSVADGFAGWSGAMTAHSGARVRAAYDSAGAAGTIYLQKGAVAAMDSIAIVDNNGVTMTREGYAEIGSGTASDKLGALVVRNAGRIKIMSRARAMDVDLATADVKLNVGTNILTVSAATHKNGKGWADTVENLVVRETDPGTGVTGDIIWRQGLVFVIR